MKSRKAVTLRAHLKRLVAGSLVILGFTAAAAAFAAGFNGALLHALADPASPPRLRATALVRVDEALGYGGFLRAYGAYVATGDAQRGAELRRFVEEAEANLDAYTNAATSEADRRYAQTLRRLETPFRRATPSANGSGAASEIVTAGQLERDYALIKQTAIAANQAANAATIEAVSNALLWAQVTSITVFCAMAALLLSLVWFLRERMVGPLGRLRRTILASASGARDEPLWGMTRGDEIGALARAADKLRQRAGAGESESLPRVHLQLLERLAKGASQLESDLVKSAAATEQAQDRIETASLRAAKASEAAIDAARLAKQGAARLAQHSEDLANAARRQSRGAIDALIGAVDQLSRAASRWEMDASSEDLRVSTPVLGEYGDTDTAAVLDNLAGGLDALEKFARERRSLGDDQLLTLTAALLQAMERLTTVAHRITGGDREIRAAE